MKSYNPVSLEELTLLQPLLPKKVQLIAGGTDWGIAHRKDTHDIPAILWLGGIPELQTITEEKNGGVTIGACCTMAAIERSTIAARNCNVIAEAAAVVGSAQIRNIATIGGNIANASPAADLAAPLIALDAIASVLRNGRIIKVPVAELIVGANRTSLLPRDVILNFSIPASSCKGESHYHKLGFRKQVSISRFGIAIALQRENELIAEAHIAIGAISERAERMPEMETAIVGHRIDKNTSLLLGRMLSDHIRNTSRRQYKAWSACAVMEDALAMFCDNSLPQTKPL